VVAIHRHCRFHHRPITRLRFDLEFAPEHLGALAHADQAEVTVLPRRCRVIRVERTPVVRHLQTDVPVAFQQLELRFGCVVNG
jgi:hypothetical protein